MDAQDRKLYATVYIVGGLGTATMLVLHATGRSREAAVLGVAGALFSAVVGALQLTRG